LIGLLGQGHILLEGVPGLAKTFINTLSQAIHGYSAESSLLRFIACRRCRTMIYNIKANEFSIRTYFLCINDEINRAPAKVQSALLEAMQEKQVTIGDTTF
jgi:MoxR-like ATPase